MRITVRADAKVADVLRRMGVAEADLAAAAKAAGVDAATTIKAGGQIVVDDKLVRGGQASSVVQVREPVPGRGERAAGVGQALGALGLFGVQAGFDRKSGDNDLGTLSSLAALGIDIAALDPAAVAQLLDRAKLDVRVPLLPGVRAIPLGDKRVLVEVPPGTVATLSVTLSPKPPRELLAIRSADLALSKDVVVKNPADLSFVDKSALADLANHLVTVKLSGVHVDDDGTVTPQGSITRPSMNLFKHVLGNGTSEDSLSTWLALTGKPRVRTSVADIAKGDVVKDKTAFASEGVPMHFEPGALFDALGAVASEGSFTLRVDGRGGFVDVGRGKATIVGAGDRKLSATVTGKFAMREGGGVEVSSETKLHAPVDARINFDESGAPGASIGPIAVTAKDGAVEIAVQGALLAAVKALAGRYHVALPPGVDVHFDGSALIHAHATIKADGSSLVVESGDVKAVVDAAGAHASSDLFDVTLGAGSQIEIGATGIGFAGADLVVDNVDAGFSATAAGVGKKGPFSAALEGAQASGSLDLDLSNADPSGDGSITWSLSARPKLGFLPLPGRGHVDGEAQVLLRKDAIGVRSANKLRFGLG